MAAPIVLPVSGAYAQSNDVFNRLNRLENELDTLNRAVYRGEMPNLTQMPDTNAIPPAGGTIANGEVRLQQLETQMRDLTGMIEEQRYELNRLKMDVGNLQTSQQQAQQNSAAPAQPGRPVFANSQFATPQTSIQRPLREQSVQAGTSVVEGSNNQGVQTLPGNGSANDPTLRYEQAFADLKNERYQQAQAGFESFLKDHESHVLASNAKYWLGETFYVQGFFDRAARIFAEGYRSYPDSPKAPDNLLKLGMSLAGLGKTDDACVALKQLPKKHANGPGPVLSRGTQEMERLGCS